MPEISVVIPTFNSQEFIERSLSSVINQTLPPKEVIVVDDGSKDKTLEIAQGLSERFVQKGIDFKLLQNRHLGPGFTRNAGIWAASCEWVAFLDSDDAWTSEKIEACAEQMKDGINFVTHWEVYKKLDGSDVTLKHARYDLNKELPSQIYRRNLFSTSAVICKRALLQEVGGFDPSLPVSQDYDLWLRLSPYIRLAVIEKNLGYYFEHGESITARPYWKRYPHFARLVIKNRKFGSVGTMIYLLARSTFSRQWVTSFRNVLLSKSSH